MNSNSLNEFIRFDYLGMFLIVFKSRKDPNASLNKVNGSPDRLKLTKIIMVQRATETINRFSKPVDTLYPTAMDDYINIFGCTKKLRNLSSISHA